MMQGLKCFCCGHLLHIINECYQNNYCRHHKLVRSICIASGEPATRRSILSCTRPNLHLSPARDERGANAHKKKTLFFCSLNICKGLRRWLQSWESSRRSPRQINNHEPRKSLAKLNHVTQARHQGPQKSRASETGIRNWWYRFRIIAPFSLGAGEKQEIESLAGYGNVSAKMTGRSSRGWRFQTLPCAAMADVGQTQGSVCHR